MQSVPVESIFSRAWTLLARNPVIVVPGLVVGVAAGLVQGAVSPAASLSADHPIAFSIGTAISSFVAIAVGILAFLITQTFTTGMAAAAWERGNATLADGRQAFAEDAARLLGAMVLLVVLAIVVAIFTFGIGVFVLLFFALYMVPAVVIDNDAALTALKVSARIARRRVVSTLIIVVMLFAIELVLALLVTPLAFVPFLGPVIIDVVFQAVTAYTTLVIVGEYLAVRRAPDIAAGPTL